MERICQTLHNNPELSTSELSKKIVEFIRVNNFNPSPFQDGLTQSAVKLEKMDELKQALDDLAQLYLAYPDTLASHLNSVYKEIMSFNESTVDIYDFAHELLKVESDPLRRSQLELVKECLQDAVIASMDSHREMSGEILRDSVVASKFVGLLLDAIFAEKTRAGTNM